MIVQAEKQSIDADFESAFKPTFIGNFRSGTTLLSNLLGLHEEIVPWFETKWMCEALRYLRVLMNPGQHDSEAALIAGGGPKVFKPVAVSERMIRDIMETAARINGRIDHGKAAHERYILGNDYILYSEEDAVAAVSDWLEKVDGGKDPQVVAMATGHLIKSLGHRQAILSNKPYWINKTPEICRFGKELRLCLGSARIILMIRNGRDVVRSAESLGWAKVCQLTEWWRGMIEQSREASAGHENDYLEVRYEAFVDQPVEGLNNVFRFLGVDEFGDRLVQEYQKQIAICRVHSGVEGKCKELSTDGEERLEDVIDRDFMMSLGYV